MTSKRYLLSMVAHFININIELVLDKIITVKLEVRIMWLWDTVFKVCRFFLIICLSLFAALI